MAEWEQLEELESALADTSRSKRKSRTRTSNASVVNSTNDDAIMNDTAAASVASVVASSPSDNAPVASLSPAAAAVSSSTNVVTAAASSAATSISAASSARSAAAAYIGSSLSSELERLRAENETLRAKLQAVNSTGSDTATIAAASSSSASSRRPRAPRLTEFPKASISYRHVSHRVRKYLDTLLMQAEVDDDRRSDSDGEEETMEALVGATAETSTGSSTQPVQYFESFCIDRAGIRRVRSAMTQALDYQLFDVPTYEGPINIVPLPVTRTEAGDLDISFMLGSCFNCGASHQLRECPYPREETCIRLNSMLFREYAQGRSKQDGSVLMQRQQSGGGGGGSTGYSGRYYNEESFKPDDEEENEKKSGEKKAHEHDGEIHLDEDADEKTSANADSKPASASSDSHYILHSLDPSKLTAPSPSTLLALSALARSDLQVIDRDEDELDTTEAMKEIPSVEQIRLRQRLSSGSAAATATPIKSPVSSDRDRIVIDSDDDDDDDAQPAKRVKLNDSTPAAARSTSNTTTASPATAPPSTPVRSNNQIALGALVAPLYTRAGVSSSPLTNLSAVTPTPSASYPPPRTPDYSVAAASSSSLSTPSTGGRGQVLHSSSSPSHQQPPPQISAQSHPSLPRPSPVSQPPLPQQQQPPPQSHPYQQPYYSQHAPPPPPPPPNYGYPPFSAHYPQYAGQSGPSPPPQGYASYPPPNGYPPYGYAPPYGQPPPPPPPQHGYPSYPPAALYAVQVGAPYPPTMTQRPPPTPPHARDVFAPM